jgi:inner membrane protein
VAEQGDGYYIGYQSVFDEEPLDLKFNARNDDQANSITDHEELEILKRFSKGYYVITNKNDTLIFNDVRFGQVFGWNDPEAEFVFQYNLTHADANVLVIQRGRFSNLTKDNLRETLKRMRGK